MRTQIVLGCILIVVLGAGFGALAQTTGPRVPPLVIRSVAGRDLFDFYCATCHGRDAKGKGPVAEALTVAPPDLTRLALDNGGAFPRQRVETFITHDGRVATPAHGTSDMPVWGPVFRGLDPSDTLVKVRIANVVDYIASIQAK
jgi:mono/diheme cytochrome c family protein